MKILLFGKHGQIGWELTRSLAPLGEVIALGSTDRELCGNLADLEGIHTTVAQVAPDVIVNAAAYTAVDQAESATEQAELLNAVAPGILAEAAARSDALLVHYSTDYVFDGSGERPWQEGDPVRPLNAYGLSKAHGEQAIAAAGCRYLLLRTSWVYAARGNNFLRTMLELAGRCESLTVVNDQRGVPTGAELIADVTAHVISAVARGDGDCGTYHLTAAGATCWHEYAGFAISTARALGMPVQVGEFAIKGTPTSEYPTAAPRPLNSRLDTSRLRETFGLTLPDWRVGVERVVQELAQR